MKVAIFAGSIGAGGVNIYGRLTIGHFNFEVDLFSKKEVPGMDILIGLLS